MATLFHSDNTWKCLGYPPQALRTQDELRQELMAGIIFDGFDRTELGPDWSVIHYDGSGSITLNGSTITVSSGGSGDFWDRTDGGSMVYRPLPTDWQAVEVDVMNSSQISGGLRLLMVRASSAANAPFLAIVPDSDATHLTLVWRDTAGGVAVYAGDNMGAAWDKSQPLRLRLERNQQGITALFSQNQGYTWATIGSRSMPEMTLVCLPATLHSPGYVVYDHFKLLRNGASSTHVIPSRAGLQLDSVPGNGEYQSQPLSLQGFKATGTPAISWTSGVVVKPFISETTQADFQAGTLSGVVATARGLQLANTQTARWMDVSYNDTLWPSAYDNGAYGIGPWGAVSNWPDPNAHWIWDRPSTSNAPIGSCYFRKALSLSAATDVTIYIICDNKFELYVDGNLGLMGDDWRKTTGYNVTLGAGSHVIAVWGTNGDTSDNPAGLLVSVKRKSDGAFILRSDGSWKCLGYPATPPGDMSVSTNVAQGKPYSYSPNATPESTWGDGDVTDGNTDFIKYDGLTSTNGQPVWCQVDLGAVYRIGAVKVWHYYGDGRTYHQTKTQVSEDGMNWVTVFDSAVSGEYQETSAGKTHTFQARPVRYIRDFTNGSTANPSNHWIEIQAFLCGTGTRTSPVYDLSPVGIAADSSISWNATIPAGTSVTVETNLSLDGGVTWQGWQVCTNGGPVPGISDGTDLSHAQLQIRQTLDTTDPFVIPQLQDLSVAIQPLNVTTSTTFEVDLSLDGGTTWSGWQSVSNGNALPGIDATTNLDLVTIRYKLTLSSNDTISPVVHSVSMEGVADWTEVLYNDSSWASAYDDGAYGISPWGTNSTWVDPQARWIWDRASTSSAPVGSVYFRKKFSLAEPQWITIAFACDDKADLYIDGQYLLGNTGYQNTAGSSVYLSAGEHVIAVKATNTGGYAALMATIRNCFVGQVGSSIPVGSRAARNFAGTKALPTIGLRQTRDFVGVYAPPIFGLRQERNLTANVYIVDIINTGQATRKVGDYFLGVRTAMDQEMPGSGGSTPMVVRRLPFAWVPPVHIRWRQKEQ